MQSSPLFWVLLCRTRSAYLIKRNLTAKQSACKTFNSMEMLVLRDSDAAVFVLFV
jgi:hypothetical protein